MTISYIDTIGDKVLCPFYNYSESRRHKIICEGITEGSTTTLFYQKKKDFLIQMDVFCCEHYAKCEVYNMLMAAKYSGE